MASGAAARPIDKKAESEELLERLKAAAEDATAPVRRPRIRPMISELVRMYRKRQKRSSEGG